jgi:mRNA interferase MazF
MENLSMVKGKIVLVQFPFDDFSSLKVRPAVSLTEPVGNFRHVVLAFITSKVPPDLLESDLILDSGRPDFKTTGLAVTSTIRLHRLTTVTVSMIKRELGILPESLSIEVCHRLKKMFEL